MNDILNFRVSFQENTWTNVSAVEPTIKDVLNAINSDRLKQQVTDLRTNLEKGNLVYYDDNKKRLPAVTFSGTFNANRTRENVKQYNSLIVLDLPILKKEPLVLNCQKAWTFRPNWENLNLPDKNLNWPVPFGVLFL